MFRGRSALATQPNLRILTAAPPCHEKQGDLIPAMIGDSASHTWIKSSYRSSQPCTDKTCKVRNILPQMTVIPFSLTGIPPAWRARIQIVFHTLLSGKDLLRRRIDKFHTIAIQADLNRACWRVNLIRQNPCDERCGSHPQVHEGFMS